VFCTSTSRRCRNIVTLTNPMTLTRCHRHRPMVHPLCPTHRKPVHPLPSSLLQVPPRVHAPTIGTACVTPAQFASVGATTCHHVISKQIWLDSLGERRTWHLRKSMMNSQRCPTGPALITLAKLCVGIAPQSAQAPDAGCADDTDADGSDAGDSIYSGHFDWAAVCTASCHGHCHSGEGVCHSGRLLDQSVAEVDQHLQAKFKLKGSWFHISGSVAIMYAEHSLLSFRHGLLAGWAKILTNIVVNIFFALFKPRPSFDLVYQFRLDKLLSSLTAKLSMFLFLFRIGLEDFAILHLPSKTLRWRVTNSL